MTPLTFSWLIDKAISHLLIKRIFEHMLTGVIHSHTHCQRSDDTLTVVATVQGLFYTLCAS